MLGFILIPSSWSDLKTTFHLIFHFPGCEINSLVTHKHNPNLLFVLFLLLSQKGLGLKRTFYKRLLILLGWIKARAVTLQEENSNRKEKSEGIWDIQ